MWLHLITTFALIQIVISSSGDSSPYFERCIDNCQFMNCTKDGLGFIGTINQPIYLKLLSWDCQSECKYECMWKTTEAFRSRNWKVPQFYGKWPFVRILGIQEPASFIFSIMNLFGHIVGFQKFRRQVRSDSPLYWLWQSLILIALNAWIWSCIFHARDFPFTEYMDYNCAFSIILMHCYCMVQRLLHGMPRFFNTIISTFFIAFFINHSIYLSAGRVDYGYNMKLHLIMGGVTVFIWFMWSFLNRKQQPYLWKCAAFFSLTAFFSCLEIFDFAPILWTFDSHSIWHLMTAFLCPIFYSFIIDDCKYLRKISEYKSKNV